MGQFEEYTQKKQQDIELLYRTVKDKKIEENPYGETAYSPEEYEEILKQRSDESMFKEQKAYYFTDKGLLDSKAARYQKMSGDADGSVAQFAETHKNRSVRKRKRKAKAAAKSFEKAAQLAKDVKLKDLSPVEQFRHESKIMKLHLEGRIEAAKAKSTSKENEDYRIAKAKYSCAATMKNQVDALLKQDPENAELLSAAQKLGEQLEKARKDFVKKAPSSKQKWEKAQDFDNKRELTRQLEEHKKRNAAYTEEDVKIENIYLYFQNDNLQYIDQNIKLGKGPYNYAPGDQDRIVRSMCRAVYKDKNGKPISAEEARKEAFNQKWIGLCLEDSKDRLKEAKEKGASPDQIRDLEEEVEEKSYERRQMIQESIDRFMATPMISPEELEQKKPLTIFLENPAWVYENMHFCLTLDNLQHVEPYAKKYMEEHPELDLKVRAWNQMAGALINQLDCEHLIRQGKSVNELAEKEESDISSLLSEYREHYENLKKTEAAEAKKEEAYEKDKTAEKPQKVKDREAQEQEAAYFKEKRERREYAANMKPKSIEELRRVNPDITEEGYAIYLQASKSHHVVNDPALLASVDRARKVYPRTEFTLSRLYMPILKDTEYNDRFEPATEKAKEADAWNRKWCEAIEKKDVKTQDEMIMQMLPTFFEDSGITLPKPEEIEAGTEKILKEQVGDYIHLAAKNLGLNNLEHFNESTKKYIAEHPKFNAMMQMCKTFCDYVEYFAQAKYGIDIHTGGTAMKAIPPQSMGMYSGLLEGFAEDYKKAYNAYQSQ